MVAPSYSPLMVRVATRIGSTSSRSVATRWTARTILLTSTSSESPLRLRTCMVTRVGGGAAVTVMSLLASPVVDRSAHTRRRRSRAWRTGPSVAVGRPSRRRTTAPDGCGALAGLRTRGRVVRHLSVPPDPYWPSLPRGSLSGVLQCFVTAVVPTHRCGAVPESHRVPSCLVPSRRAEPAARSAYVGPSASPRTTSCVACRAFPRVPEWAHEDRDRRSLGLPR